MGRDGWLRRFWSASVLKAAEAVISVGDSAWKSVKMKEG